METPKILFLVGAACAALTVQTASGAPQIFTKNSGQKINGEIVDARVGSVTLLAEGYETTYALSDFSQADQEIFEEWGRREKGLFDWCSERGYRYDGSTDEVISEQEPKILWRARIGKGDAPVVANADWAVATGVVGSKFTVTVFDLNKSSEAWKVDYSVTTGDARASAAAYIDKLKSTVTTVGANGRIDSWELKTGKSKWATGLRRSYPKSKPPVDNRYGSPLLHDDQLFVEVGGPACSMVQLSTANGREQWRIGKYQSVGAPPIFATLSEQELILSRNQYGLVARRPQSGAKAWEQAWPDRPGYAAPLVIAKNRVFVTSATECALFQIKGIEVSKLWSNANLCSRHAAPVFSDGYLYGIHGTKLRCIDAKSGEIKWTANGIAAGNLIRAAEQLVIQAATSGEVIFAEVTPEGFKEKRRFKAFEGASQAMPILATGRLFCRSANGDLTCVDLGAKSKSERRPLKRPPTPIRGVRNR